MIIFFTHCRCQMVNEMIETAETKSGYDCIQETRNHPAYMDSLEEKLKVITSEVEEMSKIRDKALQACHDTKVNILIAAAPVYTIPIIDQFENETG